MPQQKKVTITISEAFQQQLVRDNQSLVIPRVPFKPGSTRSYPNFDIEKEPLLVAFIANLTSFDGG